MSHRTLSIVIDNHSQALLECSSQTVVSGLFSADALPPEFILPEAQGVFRLEKASAFGFVAISGMRGSVEYRFGDEEEHAWLRMVWNIPLWGWRKRMPVEVEVSPGWDAATMIDRADPRLIRIRLRRTRRQAVPRFDPIVHGFTFINSWARHLPVVTPGFVWNRMVDRLPRLVQRLRLASKRENRFALTRAHQGLCGGMVFSVIDYHNARQLPPRLPISPPEIDDPIFLFIKRRLWDSFDIPWGGLRYLIYSLPFYPNASTLGPGNLFGFLKGRVRVSYQEEWPKIRADIDAGKLSPIGLVQTATFRISEDHQVLAYGYEQSGSQVTLFIYDPNEGPTEVSYRFRPGRGASWVEVERTPPNSQRIWCFFRTNHYQFQSPPESRPTTEENR